MRTKRPSLVPTTVPATVRTPVLWRHTLYDVCASFAGGNVDWLERLKMGELLAAVYDPLIGPFDPLGVNEWRAWIASATRGRVLELGVGTGRNLPHYHRAGPHAVGATASTETVAAIDPDYASLRRAFSRRNGNSSWITLYQARAEALPFADSCFDVVVGTLVFCTIADPSRALQEVRRVLKPGGQFRLVEHVRVHNRLLAGMQDLTTPLWEKIGAGCHLNRDTVAAVELAGFRILGVHNHLGGLFVGIDAINRPSRSRNVWSHSVMNGEEETYEAPRSGLRDDG